MKANRAVAIAALIALGACASPRKAPPPAPTPAPPVVVRPAPLPPPPPRDWRDAPATPGDWTWALAEGRSTARFALGAQPPLFTMACDRMAGSVVLTRAGAATGSMALYTTSGNRSVTAAATPTGAAASLPARDPFLDAIAFSRGRFAVELAGASPLYLPSWPEVTRVLEDCR